MAAIDEAGWDLGPSQFPGDGSFDAVARFFVACAVLAPSGHNTQPWRFAIGPECIDVYADRTRALPVVDPQDRELVISCGAATGIIEVAAQRFGYDVQVILFPDPDDSDLLARLKLRQDGAPDRMGSDLYNAIFNRRTTRLAFEPDPVPSEMSAAFETETKRFDVAFRLITADDDKQAIAGLVAQGDRIQFADRSFRHELASWVHSSTLGSRDGVSGAGFGLPDVLSPLGQLVIRTFDLGNGIAASDAAKITEATPALALLSSTSDTQDDWLNTGRALAHVLLVATSGGFTSSYLNQPIETPELRPKLRDISGIAEHPQILLRMGRAPRQPGPTVRRPLSDVILAWPVG